MNAIDLPDALTANQLDQAHDGFAVMKQNHRDAVCHLRSEITEYAAGVTCTLTMVPHIEVFHMSKLLIPRLQIGIQMYFNSPDLWTMRYDGAVVFRLNPEIWRRTSPSPPPAIDTGAPSPSNRHGAGRELKPINPPKPSNGVPGKSIVSE